MKLRNKKTGKIIEYSISLNQWSEDVQKWYLFGIYDSIDELKEEWEDYTPAEPLIKDERIRRAVRAWVEIGKYERVYYDRAYNRLADDHDFVHCIEFAIDPCPEAESGRCYTLTELCGEEEE